VTHVRLLRHGEVASYEGDHGLTARGTEQARTAAAEVRGWVGGASAQLRHATSGRATETAAALAAALPGLDGPYPDPGFDNFFNAVGGRVTPHDAMRPAITAARADGAWPRAHPATWELEVDRFATIHDSGGDPIEWWLRHPTLAMEPPARAVRRFWRALTALVAERTIVCTHSGPMRALAAHALGCDAGEPEHLEAVDVRLDGARAEVTYRGRTAALAVPDLAEPAWP